MDRGIGANPSPPGCEKLTGAERDRMWQGAWQEPRALNDELVTVVVVQVGHRREGDR